MKNYIGLNIKYLCDKNLLSQKDFGGIFGLTQAVVNAYIKEKSNPQVETIQKICQHFEITIDEFINLDLSSLPQKTAKAFKTSEPSEVYNNDKELIKALKQTIEVQNTLIENYKQQLGQAS